MPLFSEESKDQCAAVVKRLKEIIKDKQEERVFNPEDNDVLITSILTLDFFMADSMPFDRQTINRMDQELDICNRIIARYQPRRT